MSAAEDVKKDWAVPVPRRPRCSNASCRKPCRPSETVNDEAGLPYCSTSCGTAKADSLSQAALRRAVYLRDGGVCSSCGLDAEKLRAEIDGLFRDAALVVVQARIHMLVRVGFDRHAVESRAASRRPARRSR